MATSMDDELIDNFVTVTGASRDVAMNMLEACSGNLELAVGMHMDGPGASPQLGSGAGPSSGASEHIPRLEGDDSVRAPIPQKTEVLVEEDNTTKIASWRMRRPRRHAASVFDGFRDFQAETNHYDDVLRGKRPSKKRNLEDLFRPPVDITYKGTFQNAKDVGSDQNKWLLVNVQNVQEFPCQTLNRDVWSNQNVRNVIKESFIFWQVYNDSEEGKRFMQFYKLLQWPYVAIIDPFTGENQVVWNKISDGNVFCELAKEFLSNCPVPDTSQAVPTAKRQKRESSIVDASENDQMEAAIRASLEEQQAKPSSPEYVMDSDSEADLADSDEVETFSDSDEIIVSSTPPRPTNGASSSSSHVSESPSSKVTLSKAERLKKQLLLSSSSSNSSSSAVLSSHQPSSSVSSLPLPAARRLSQSSEVRISSRDPSEAEPSSSSSIWRDSPLEVNIENSLIDMIGGRGSEVCTPDVCTLDSSPSNSQPAMLDDEGNRDSGVSSEASTQNSGSWKDHWGDSTDPLSKIVIRFPENRREIVELPSSSTLKALTEFCKSKGFPEDKFEMVTNFPRRKLSEMPSSTTLADAGLYPQETVFLQDR